MKQRAASGWIAVSLVLLLPALAGGQEPKKIDFAPLDAIAAEELRTSNTPGTALAVVQGDRVIFSKGFGVASVETGATVTPDMLFRLGSTTKMFVATAMVQLAEQGKIKLEAPVGEYVKNLPPKVARLTTHQLLTHTAGLTDESPMHGLHDDSALAKGVRGFTDDYFFTEPGRIYSYSNAGYWIAGVVFEEITGKSFADAMTARVFAPLGMERTTFRPTVAMTYPLAIGHDLQAGKPVVTRPLGDNAATWPAGQMFSNVGEFARFAIAFLNHGVLDGKQVLSPTLIEKLATGHVDTPGTGGKYGYGLGVRTTQGIDFLGHGGSRLGYGSALTMAPKQRIAVVVVANKTGASMPKTADKAMELALGIEKKGKAQPKKPLEMTPEEMARVAGVYTNNRITVKWLVKDGKLVTAKGEQVSKVGDHAYRIAAMAEAPAQDFVVVPVAAGEQYLVRQGRALRKQ